MELYTRGATLSGASEVAHNALPLVSLSLTSSGSFSVWSRRGLYDVVRALIGYGFESPPPAYSYV